MKKRIIGILISMVLVLTNFSIAPTSKANAVRFKSLADIRSGISQNTHDLSTWREDSEFLQAMNHSSANKYASLYKKPGVGPTKRSFNNQLLEEEISLAELATENGVYYYFIQDGVATIAYYTGTDKSLSIPDSIENCAVTSIFSMAFYGCTELETLVIPDTIASIGALAFADCTSLTEVDLGKGVSEILMGAFAGCTKLSSIFIPSSAITWSGAFMESSLVNVVIEDGVTSIPSLAFAGCINLMTVSIPASVTDIGDMAFTACSSIESISLTDSVASIGIMAFASCSALREIFIPKSIIAIGESAFSDCDAMSAIAVDPDNELFSSLDGVLFNKEQTILIKYPQACSAISYLVPSTVVTIGYDSFSDNSFLESVVLPDSLLSIEENAFFQDSALSSITIPKSVMLIGVFSFVDCNSLVEYQVDSGNKSFASKDGVLFNKGLNTLVKYPQAANASTYTMPETVTTLGEGAFAMASNLTSILFSDNLESIAPFSFYQCKELQTVILPDSVVLVAEGAFNECSALNSVTIGFGVETIQMYAFAGCTSLLDITIPGNVVNWSYAFSESNLVNVTIGPNLSSVSEYAFAYSMDLQTVTVLDGTMEIAESAFDNCANLSEVNLPGTLTTIGDAAFYDCQALKTINLPESLISIGVSAFFDCIVLENIELQASLIIIGDGAFNACEALTSVVIPASVETIGVYAFEYCNALTSFDVHQDNTFYSSLEGVLFNKDKTTLIQYPAAREGEHYNVPLTVTLIADSAMEMSTHLVEITLPDSLIEIGPWAFCGCENLTSLVFPSHLETLGYSLFIDCFKLKNIVVPANLVVWEGAFMRSSLETVVIENGVTSISQYAFAGCEMLASLSIPSSVTLISEGAFAECISLTELFVPDTVTDIADFVFEGCENLTIYGFADSPVMYYAENSGIRFIIASLPEAPSVLWTKARTDKSLQLSWSAVPGAKGYNIYLNGILQNEEPVKTLEFTILDLEMNTSYAIDVKTINIVGEGLIGRNVDFKTGITAIQTPLTVSKVIGRVGDIVTLSIQIPENSKLAAGTFEISYDPDLLEYITATKGAILTSGTTDIYYDEVNHKIVMAYMNPVELNIGGSIMDIQFKIKSGIPEQVIDMNLVVVDFIDVTLQPLPFAATNGTITLIDLILGDLNGDGIISSTDALKALQAASGRITLTENEKMAADINKDGKISTSDALKILHRSSGRLSSFQP